MSRSRKSRGGGGGGSGKIGRFAFAIFVLAGIVAIYQIPYDPGVSGVTEIAQSKAEHAGEWAQSVAPNIENFVGGILKGGSEEPTGFLPEGGEGYPEETGNPEVEVGSYEDGQKAEGS